MKIQTISKNLCRCRILFLFFFLAFSMMGIPEPFAAGYPDRSITLVIPWPAGGATDMLGRMLASEVEKYIGQQVVVVNKTGGGGAIGHTFGAQAKPDGYTITLATTEASTVHLLGVSPFSYRDFDPLLLIATGPAGFSVLSSSPYKTFKDLLEDAKKRPEQIKVSSIAAGGIWNLCAVAISKKAGIQLNILPYAGGGPAVVAALGGHVDAACVGFAETLSHARDGKMRYLGVTSGQRLPTYPDAPTFVEQGIPVDLGAWWGICLPKGTPKDIQAKIHEAFRKAIHDEKIKDMMAKGGFIHNYKGPEEFKVWLDGMDKVFKEVIGK
jgi:tripartite-type tricarboxylate transporter receptor subunit TctC